MYPRFAADAIITGLSDTRVVLVVGPRQAGKSTLVKAIAGTERPYLTLDDETTLRLARSDPKGFIRGLDRAAIDEVQRAPELILAIKESVDGDRRPGRFLLTGSANVMSLPTIADSLAGRMEVITLLPLSRAEIAARKPSFIERAFESSVAAPGSSPVVGDALMEVVLAGGYPEVLARSTPSRRTKWCLDYIDAIVHRDVREIAEVARLGDMPRLIRLIAHHSAQLVNYTEMASPLAMDRKTAQRYLEILSALFIVRAIEPWHSNQISRITKSPKMHFLDSGLLGAMRGSSIESMRADKVAFGAVLESFVFSELLKQVGWLPGQAISIHHFRTTTSRPDEVDFVLEDRRRNVLGIEVKASATVSPSDFNGMRKLAEATKAYFKLGVVLYDGDKVIPYGQNMYAVPISNLWN